jgi:hypothetical protein
VAVGVAVWAAVAVPVTVVGGVAVLVGELV